GAGDGKKLGGVVRRAEGKEERHSKGPLLLAEQQSILQGLPLLKGGACRLDKSKARGFFQAVAKVRETLGPGSDPSLPGDDVNIAKLRYHLTWLTAQETGARACLQMLQPGNWTIRDVMTEVLEKTPGPEASRALAQRAVTDLSPRMRATARKALAQRPAEEYQQILVNYLNYPWAPVAEHAAETLVALDAKGAVPTLVKLLNGPDAT